jgi:hypothetical protein
VIYDACRATLVVQASVDSRKALLSFLSPQQLSVSNSLHVFFQINLKAELDRSASLSALHAEVRVSSSLQCVLFNRCPGSAGSKF